MRELRGITYAETWFERPGVRDKCGVRYMRGVRDKYGVRYMRGVRSRRGVGEQYCLCHERSQ